MKRRSRHMRKLLLIGIVLLALAGIGAASAATNLVKNGGFEEPSLGENVGFVECPDGVVQDWVIGGEGIDQIRTYWAPSEGLQSIDLSRLGRGSVSQLLPTTVGGTYTLSFAMAGNPECGPEEKLLKVYWGDQPAFGPYSYITTGYPYIGPGGWVTVTLADLPGTAGGTQLTFEDVSTPSSACGVALDNVIVTSKELVPVPEFPTLALPVGFIVGLLGAVVYIRSTQEE
jgi:hypothetical protein